MTDNVDDRRTPRPQAEHVAVHGYFIRAEVPSAEERIGPRQVLAGILRHRFLFLACVLAFGAASVIWALLAEPVYQSQTLVKVVEETEGLSGSSPLGQLGGLAALAGLRLPGGNDRAEAIAVLQSNSLAAQFIEQHELTPLLFRNRWDAESKRWRRGAKPPSSAEAVKRFAKRVRTVQEDKLTGLVRVTMRWSDPQVAATWANQLVQLANERMRTRAIDEANRGLRFLEKEIEKTRNIELQQVIYRLMQERLNTATLASVRSEYGLQTIDPAQAADSNDYVWPRPAVLLALGLLAGLFAGSLLALLLERRRRTA